MKIGKVAFLMGFILTFATDAPAQRQMERIGRAVIALNIGDGQVYVGWRMLGTDSDEVAFNLYRSTNGAKAVRINTEPITTSTNFVDTAADAN